MILRGDYLEQLATAVARSPITAILGPRQAGKTTLARCFAQEKQAAFFDLESQPDRRRLQNPELALGGLSGLVILDEIQLQPELFAVLRVLVDRPENKVRFLILGSASPDIIANVSQTLAGRVEFIELTGFQLSEVGVDAWQTLWLRGGFPRSFLATRDEDSVAWREGFIRTFLERDVPQLGFQIPGAAMRRFGTMLAHCHGQIWNGAELSRAMGLTAKTVRRYLDILSGTFMIRQLQPWFANVSKRQVKSPKIYFHDAGLLHQLLGLSYWDDLLAHPKVGASWEGFVLEQVWRALDLSEAYFWAAHGGAELDLLFFYNGRAYGLEVKFNEAPTITRSMRTAIESLNLAHLWIIYPGQHSYPVAENVTMLPLTELDALRRQLNS
jgi:predicted AAA+ superfamily ATPase